MTRFLPRVRGALIRLTRRRILSFLVGLALAVPSAWVEFSGRFGAVAEGVALVVGATGVAIVWQAVVGATPDWR